MKGIGRSGITTKVFILLIHVMFLFAVQDPSRAEISLGPFELHPYLQVSESYEENTFRCKEGAPTSSGICVEESDFHTLLIPGLQIRLPEEDHQLLIEYRGDFAYYTDFKSENYDDNEVSIDYKGSFIPRLDLFVKGHFLDGHDSREVSPLREIDFFTSLGGNVELLYSPTEKIGLRGGFEYFYLDHFADGRNDFRDRSDFIYSLGAILELISEVEALIDYSFARAIYNDQGQSIIGNINNKTHRVSSGIQWKLSDEVHGSITGGYALKDFEDAAKGEFDTAIFSARIAYRLPTETRVNLRGGRELKEPNLDGQGFYITTGGALDLVHPILPELEGTLSFSGGRESYYQDPMATGRIRKENTYRIQAGLDYTPFPWMVAGVAYAFSNTDSGWFSNQFDYLNHVVTVRVAVFN